MANPFQMGMQILNQVKGLQNPGAGGMPGMSLPTPGGAPASGTPDFINNGFIAKMMSGNPGGLLGALMNRSTMPVNPGAPPPPGDPAYVPGGQGPMAGGAPIGGGGLFGADKAGIAGMLGKILPGIGG